MDVLNYLDIQDLFSGEFLTNRWLGHTDELQELIPIIRNNNDWHTSEAYTTLIAKLPPDPKGGVRPVKRDLRGANLSRAQLKGANLSETSISGVNLSGAWLDNSNLSGAKGFDANLSEAYLSSANLSRAQLDQANLSGAHLRGANLSGAWLQEVNLSRADLREIKYITDEMFDRITKGRRFGITRFEGIDTSKINSSANPVLKRHIEDYQFIIAFKNKSVFHKYLFYPLWEATSNCGRSLLLWLIWSSGFVVLFAAVYSLYLHWFITNSIKPVNLDWFNAVYFSVVTFTTLGFGDISANLENRYAQGWVMAEVIIGYIMLGGLISILANKLARRA